MQVFVAGGNLLYVNGLLHDLNELDDFVKFVEKVGMINNTMIGILPHVDPYTGFSKKSPPSPPTLKPLDMRIIGSLYTNARKPVAEIAEELNVSTRRVNKHIELMIEDNFVIFTIFWLPRTVGDIFSLMHVDFSKDIEKNVGMGNLMKKYSPKIVFCMPFTNQPQEVIAVTWSTSSLELEDLQRSVGAEDFVDSTRVNMIYRANRFDTWIDKKIFEEIEALDKS
jgi:DNA-binding Lrp family transcriptional regulator